MTVPLNNKNAKTIKTTVEGIHETSKRKPLIIEIDDGKDFSKKF